MTENMKKFTEMVSNDEALKAELETALQGAGSEDQLAAVIELAAKMGIPLTREDFAPDEKDNVSLEELEGVTGAGSCSCAFAGAGSQDGLVCFCQNIGSGIRGMGLPGSCFCYMGGQGHTGH